MFESVCTLNCCLKNRVHYKLLSLSSEDLEKIHSSWRGIGLSESNEKALAEVFFKSIRRAVLHPKVRVPEGRRSYLDVFIDFVKPSMVTPSGKNFFVETQDFWFDHLWRDRSSEERTRVFRQHFLIKSHKNNAWIHKAMSPDQRRMIIEDAVSNHSPDKGLHLFSSKSQNLKSLFELLTPRNGFEAEDLQAGRNLILQHSLVDVCGLNIANYPGELIDLLDSLEDQNITLENLSKKNREFLLRHKELFCEAILAIPNDSPQKRSILSKIVSLPEEGEVYPHENSFIRQLMWAKRGLRECSLRRGRLKEMQEAFDSLPEQHIALREASRRLVLVPALPGSEPGPELETDPLVASVVPVDALVFQLMTTFEEGAAAGTVSAVDGGKEKGSDSPALIRRSSFVLALAGVSASVGVAAAFEAE